MNLCVVSKGSFTKEDYMELYNFFKDDIAKYTDAFDMAFVKDGHVMIMCNVTVKKNFTLYLMTQNQKNLIQNLIVQIQCILCKK